MAFQQTEIGGETLLDGVMGTIRQRIASRSLTPGAKLPSIRALARTMRVSKSTVVEAYERLAAEGVIRSRPGSGFFVSAPWRRCRSRKSDRGSTAQSTLSGFRVRRLKRTPTF